MRVNRFTVTLGAVAVVAFLAGRADFEFSQDAVAQDQGKGHTQHQAFDSEMSADVQDMFMKMHEAGQPGEHHKLLDKMVGTWEGTYTWRPMPGVEPMEMSGSATREWVLGGRYLKETVKSSFQGEAFEGIGYIGFNNTTGEYEFIWMDSHSTGIYKETGAYDPTTKTLMTWSNAINPATGKMMHTQSKIDMSNATRQSMVGHATSPTGQWYKMFEGTFEKTD